MAGKHSAPLDLVYQKAAGGLLSMAGVARFRAKEGPLLIFGPFHAPLQTR
jgi:hypothetical protein